LEDNMGVSTGPIASPIIQDAVISIDADDINSVKGEPTTNVVPGAYVWLEASHYHPREHIHFQHGYVFGHVHLV